MQRQRRFVGKIFITLVVFLQATFTMNIYFNVKVFEQKTLLFFAVFSCCHLGEITPEIIEKKHIL